MIMTDGWGLPASSLYRLNVAWSPGNPSLSSSNSLVSDNHWWEGWRWGRRAWDKEGVAQPLTRTNTFRKALNSISKQCVCTCGCLQACARESVRDVQCGLHLRAPPLLLFTINFNRIAAQLSSNLMASVQPQDLLEHHVSLPVLPWPWNSPSSHPPPPPPLQSSCKQLPPSPAFSLTPHSCLLPVP